MQPEPRNINQTLPIYKDQVYSTAGTLESTSPGADAYHTQSPRNQQHQQHEPLLSERLPYTDKFTEEFVSDRGIDDATRIDIENEKRNGRCFNSNIVLVEHRRGPDWQESNDIPSNYAGASVISDQDDHERYFENNRNDEIDLNSLPVAAEVVLEEEHDKSQNMMTNQGLLVSATPIRQLSKNQLIMFIFTFCIAAVIVIFVSSYIRRNNSNNDKSGLASGGYTEKNSTLSPTSEVTSWDTEWFQLGDNIEPGMSSDEAGSSLAISRDGLSIAVGAPGTDGNKLSAVHLYRYTYPIWQHIAEIGDYDYSDMGRSVALDYSGRIVATGSPNSPTTLNNNTDYVSNYEAFNKGPGMVKIFQINTTGIDALQNAWDASRFIQKGQNITGEDQGDEFGWSIDLSDDGEIVVIASRTKCRVQAYQYKKNIDEWRKLGQPIHCIANYSYVVDISVRLSGEGTVVVVGEPSPEKESDPSLNSGENYGNLFKSQGLISMYKLSNNTWVQAGKTIVGEAWEDNFGSAVAISNSGKVVAACAPKNDVNSTSKRAADTELDPSIGSCRAYKYNDTLDSWHQLGLDIDGRELYDLFGSSVSLDDSGYVIAIGAVGSNANGDNSGYVRVLEYDKEINMWYDIGNDIVGPFAFAGSGKSVALSSLGDVVTIGAPNLELPGSDLPGGARVYETGVKVGNGEVPVTVEVSTSMNPEQISWSIDRLDVEQYETAYVMAVSEGTYSIENQTETTTVKVPVGGVFRFLIYGIYNECNNAVSDFSVKIDDQSFLGPENNNASYAQLTFITGATNAEVNDTVSGTVFITLVIDFDEHPEDIHWVILKSEQVMDPFGKQITNNRTVLAFGPESEYPPELSGQQYIETIDVSSVTREGIITFILTDDGRDGLCCDYGSGSVKVYNGTSISNDSDVLFESTAEGMKRDFKSFRLYQ